MRWPWQRDRDPAPGGGQPEGDPPATSRAAAPTAPPVAGWAFVPALQRTVGPMPTVSGVATARHALAAWGDPSSLQRMSHGVTVDAPAGLVDGDGSGLGAHATPAPGAPGTTSPAPDLPLLGPGRAQGAVRTAPQSSDGTAAPPVQRSAVPSASGPPATGPAAADPVAASAPLVSAASLALPVLQLVGRAAAAVPGAEASDDAPGSGASPTVDAAHAATGAVTSEVGSRTGEPVAPDGAGSRAPLLGAADEGGGTDGGTDGGSVPPAGASPAARAAADDGFTSVAVPPVSFPSAATPAAPVQRHVEAASPATAPSAPSAAPRAPRRLGLGSPLPATPAPAAPGPSAHHADASPWPVQRVPAPGAPSGSPADQRLGAASTPATAAGASVDRGMPVSAAPPVGATPAAAMPVVARLVDAPPVVAPSTPGTPGTPGTPTVDDPAAGSHAPTGSDGPVTQRTPDPDPTGETGDQRAATVGPEQTATADPAGALGPGLAGPVVELPARGTVEQTRPGPTTPEPLDAHAMSDAGRRTAPVVDARADALPVAGAPAGTLPVAGAGRVLPVVGRSAAHAGPVVARAATTGPADDASPDDLPHHGPAAEAGRGAEVPAGPPSSSTGATTGAPSLVVSRSVLGVGDVPPARWSPVADEPHVARSPDAAPSLPLVGGSRATHRVDADAAPAPSTLPVSRTASGPAPGATDAADPTDPTPGRPDAPGPAPVQRSASAPLVGAAGPLSEGHLAGAVQRHPDTAGTGAVQHHPDAGTGAVGGRGSDGATATPRPRPDAALLRPVQRDADTQAPGPADPQGTSTPQEDGPPELPALTAVAAAGGAATTARALLAPPTAQRTVG
ncbi:hypothetical protein AB6N24_08095, partial [Cellulomonas sp. 179-A 4D5 NHS]